MVQEIRRHLTTMRRPHPSPLPAGEGAFEACPARRRSVVAGALAGAVFGLAGSAWADDALSADTIRIPVQSGEISGFRAVPARTGPFACVVIVGDEAGLPDWVTGLCRRLAGLGYLAMGADVWAGPGEPSDAAVMRRIDAAFLMGQQHSGDPRRQALVGFGRGGRVAWLYDAQSAALRAAVAWGGALSGPTSEASSKTPLDVAGQLKAPLLGFYGQGDTGTPRSLLLKAESAAGRLAELVLYDGAQADFGIEGRPSYDKAAAMDGWDKMLAWFKRNGVV